MLRNALMTLLCLCLLSLGGFSSTCRAEGTWENFTEADGLIDNCAISLYESADGSVWIGTYGEGLNQYVDGELLTWDEGANWLPDNIYGICEDTQGDIWCLSYNEGCAYLEGGMWHEGFTLDWEGVPGLQWAQGGIGCAPDGRLWAGFAEGIKWYDPETREGQKVWTSPRYNVGDFWGVPHFLYVTSAGRIWFCSTDLGGEDKLYELDDTGTILRVFTDLWGTVEEAPDGAIWYADHRTHINFGIMRLEGDEDTIFEYAGPPEGYPIVMNGPISISDNGEIVCNGYQHALWRRVISTFDGESWQPYLCPSAGAMSRMNDLLIDKHGDIWVAFGNPGFGSGWGSGVWVLRRSQGPSPIFLGVEVDLPAVRARSAQTVLLDLLNSEDRTVDLYVAVETPVGEIHYCPGWSALPAPFLTGLHIPAKTQILDYPLFMFTLPDIPEGTYRWHAACTHAGTMEFVSNIASYEWLFTK